MRVRLEGGPAGRRYVDVAAPLPMDLIVDEEKYLFWQSDWHATDGKVWESHVYAFSERTRDKAI